MHPCEALCPFPHHNDLLQPLLMPDPPPPYSSEEPHRQNPQTLTCAP